MYIGLFGYTDKRPLVYALFKVLQNMGSVCFITDDRRYLRLTENHINCGHYQNIQIVVTDSSFDEIFEEIGQNVDDFDHVIYDMKDYIPDELDFTYVCRTITYEEDELDLIDYLPEPVKFIKFGFGNNSNKGLFKWLLDLFKPTQKANTRKKDDKLYPERLADNIATISITGELWKFCEKTEALKIIPPVPKVGILEILSNDLATPLGLTRKTLDKLLSRGGV